MAEFKRKDDYSDKLIERINDINGKYGDILFVPNRDCIKGYYKGLVLFDRITDRSEKLVDRAPFSKWDHNEDKILTEIGKGMPSVKERKTQQIIALNNMRFKKGQYSVCGFETTISQKDVNIPGKKGAPEIDLVVIRPDPDKGKRSILLVEYKCNGKSMLSGDQDIEHHYKDYMAILRSGRDVLDTIKAEMIKSYRLLCRINGIKTRDEDFVPETYKVQIAFLFVDEVRDESGELESVITEDQYAEAMKRFEGMKADLSEVLYIRCKKAEEVDLNRWNPIKGSGLRITK